MWLIPVDEESNPAQRWEWFMAQLTPQIWQILLAEAMRITGSREEAEDVVQEALIRGAMRCWQIKDEDRFCQWMYVIVRRVALRRQNKRVRAAMCSVRMAARLLPRHVNVEELIESDMRIQALRKAIDALRSPEKEIMTLKATTDMNSREIARQLGLNYNTVRSKYQRTLKLLGKLLEDE